MAITVVFDPPLPTDPPSTFDSKAFTLLGDLNDWSTQANAVANQINGAQPNLDIVAGNIANINAAVADLPALSAKVSKTGDTMTGPLSVPAGASGAQVPQAQEVVPLTGNVTMTGPLSVPAGASGAQVPQAQEIFGKSQLWQVVTGSRASGVSYTNTTGKPIIAAIQATTAATSDNMTIVGGGIRLAFASYATGSGAGIGCSAVIPPGSEYAYFWSGGMTSVVIQEYR